MAYPQYIPARDADFAQWLENFATLIAAAPTSYGLTAGDATAISNQNNAFQAAYALATDPATRTTPTIAAKDGARASAEAVVRPFAIQIRNNSAVSVELKAGLGLTIPSTTPTPIPAPIVAPALIVEQAIPLQTTLQARQPGSAGKAKPFGSIGVEVFVAIGTVAAVDPGQATYAFTATKTPFRYSYGAPDQGKVATFFARYVTRSGPGGIAQSGPFSAPLPITLI